MVRRSPAGTERYDNEAFLESLRRLAAQLGVADRVAFLGEREDVPDILAALDLLLVPSWEEPFGRVVIEAMSMSVPVIATNVGGPAEVVRDGEDGILLPPGRPATWAAVAFELLSDPGRARCAGASSPLRRRGALHARAARHGGTGGLPRGDLEVKIALVHDYLTEMGGAERVVEAHDADLPRCTALHLRVQSERLPGVRRPRRSNELRSDD